MTIAATQSPVRPHQLGDVVYRDVPGMTHGVRPCVVMDSTGLLLPLSTRTCRQLGHTTAYRIYTTPQHRAGGHPAPNRAWTPDYLPPAEGRLSRAEWDRCWDAYEAFMAR